MIYTTQDQWKPLKMMAEVMLNAEDDDAHANVFTSEKNMMGDKHTHGTNASLIVNDLFDTI